MEYNLKGIDQTYSFARSLAKNLKAKDVISLIGDLGAGKTTLTKGIGEYFGVDKDITSPTFSLVNTYYTDPVLNHMDLYRLENEDEILSLDIDELLYPDGITIIEWAEMAKSYMPRNLIEIYIDKIGDRDRKVRILSNNKREKEIIEGLNEDFSH